MFPTVNIGSLSLQTDGLIIIIGIYLGMSFVERRLPVGTITANHAYSILFIGLLVGFVSARIMYVVINNDQFLDSPGNLISLDSSLLDPYSGVLIAGLGISIYSYRKKLPFWGILDAFTPLLAVFSVALGLAHLASGKAFGVPTSLPWGTYQWGALRHPTQIYETLTSILVLLICWRKFGKSVQPGKTFLLFISLTAGARIVLETWRAENQFVFDGIRLWQLIAWLVLAVGLLFLDRKNSISRQPHDDKQSG